MTAGPSRHHPTARPDAAGRPPAPRPTGRARLGQARGRAPTPDRAATAVVRVGPEPGAPVFVDPSGTRRRRLRPFMYALIAAILLALLVLWLSQLGGPAGPPAPCAGTPTATPAGADCRR